MTDMPQGSAAPRTDLTKFAWLSIGAAVVTIGLKALAWRVTGSVGLLSDAAESVVNLVAAVVALIALRLAAKPPDENYHYGQSKAEYFSAALEGLMIFVAALVIMVGAVNRFVHPRPLENVGLGLGVSVVASLVNGAVAVVLLRAGREHRSLTLTADGKHLLTDVWTSVGVVVGVLLVVLTGWQRLDPIVAFAVGINIVITGWKLLAESTAGLMDVALPPEETAAIQATLDRFTSQEIAFHALRTRVSGYRRFMEVHILVPGDWSVQAGHDAIEDVTEALTDQFPGMRVTMHLEPIEDPRSYQDIAL